MKQVSVLRTLLVVLVLFVLLTPLSVSAAEGDDNGPYGEGAYIRGYVVDECGAGVIGAKVEIERVQTGMVYGPSVVANDRGDWGVWISGTEGDYVIRVTLPNGNVVEWYQGFGDGKVKIADAVDEIDYAWPGSEGPFTIVTDIPCTQPPGGPVFIWGNTYVRDNQPTLAAAGYVPEGVTPVGGAEVTLWFWNVFRDDDTGTLTMGWIQKGGPKTSQDGTGLFGFGIAPIPGLWKIVATSSPNLEALKGAALSLTVAQGETTFYLGEGVPGMGAYGPIPVVIDGTAF